jgi:hypothetical protein
MAYAVLTHDKLDSLWLKVLYSNTFSAPIVVHISSSIIEIYQSCKPVTLF